MVSPDVNVGLFEAITITVTGVAQLVPKKRARSVRTRELQGAELQRGNYISRSSYTACYLW